ncbi:MAG: AzlC family ABC transporter permease [Acidimicrobiia bacterium]
MEDERARRRRIHRQALSISVALAPFGIVFGVACAQADLGVGAAIGFSSLVFTGSAQFAAVGVLDDGGGAATAVAAGLLLNIRCLAFGLLLAPALTGSAGTRALLAQLVIDESTAVATVQDERRWQRYGFLAGGIAVFVVWNLTTVAGVLLGSADDDFITDLGLDAAAPAAFLALLWPRLVGDGGDVGRRIAVAGALIAAASIPLAPPGIPILLAGLGVLAAHRTARAVRT